MLAQRVPAGLGTAVPAGGQRGQVCGKAADTLVDLIGHRCEE
jgi:hypothetical protein